MEHLVSIDENDFGVLVICSIRYCMGRQTYMPSLVQDIVVSNISGLSDRDLKSILREEVFQQTMELFGDENIDKPSWERFWTRLKAEAEKRNLKED